MARKKITEHYVNNVEFLYNISEFRESRIAAKENNEPPPRVTDYLGECFIAIATHLSYKPNFINYTFRDDMISDGIENCLQYIDNFDPAKSSNPFAYFTQIIYYAFLRRIQKEKKQLYVKLRAIEQSGLIDELNALGAQAPMGDQVVLYENQQEFIKAFESNLASQKKKAAAKKRKGLENFVEEEEEEKKDEI